MTRADAVGAVDILFPEVSKKLRNWSSLDRVERIASRIHISYEFSHS
jgi:hypothetical protein